MAGTHQVGTVSMEWLAGEKTKVVGTFPPRKPRGWTGYVEKDTAGQTNVYSIEVCLLLPLLSPSIYRIYISTLICFFISLGYS